MDFKSLTSSLEAKLLPKVRRDSDGIVLTDSLEASMIKRQHREKDLLPCRPAGVVKKEAEEKMKKAGGNIETSKLWLGFMEIQYGMFRGLSFRWLIENAPGYVGYLVIGMEKDEDKPADDRWINKMALKKYVQILPEGPELIEAKRKQMMKRETMKRKTASMKSKGVRVIDVQHTELSDEQLLLATQEMEQQLTAGEQSQPTRVVPATPDITRDVPTTLDTTGDVPGPLSCDTTRHVTVPSSHETTRNVTVPSSRDTTRHATVTSSHETTRNVTVPSSHDTTRHVTVTSSRETTRNVPVSTSRDLFGPTVSAHIKGNQSQLTRDVPATLETTGDVPSASSHDTTRNVTVSSSRDLFVPTVSAQRKALLSGDHLQASQATATIQKETSGTSTAPRPSPASDTSQSNVPTRGTATLQEVGDLCLPARWKKTLPKADQLWISKALFRWNQKGGVELVPEHLSQLWWYPPQPAVAVTNIPGVDRYFARPLFLWMPRKQWKVQLYCPHPGCDKQELASAGINQKVRQVTDIDGYYNMACDNLECMKCRRRVLSWSHAILSQLDIGHRVQFPCILTARHACDLKIVRLLRNRGLGNSCSQVRKKIEEQHAESWIQHEIHYLTDCSVFSSAADSSLLVRPAFANTPDRVSLPKHRWFMQIYIQDVLLRLDEMKAGITSVFGRILKIDSTKKIVKKLAGRPAKTALWCTNIGNEHGQILTSVMTSGEGHGLTPMLVGLVKRYAAALVSPPEIIYLDCDCCGSSPLQDVLTTSGWNTEIRLDIWHFMRRIATGCTTDSHQLYSSFMGLLSNCIFHWDEQDLSCLVKAKRKELAAQHLFLKADADVMKHLSRYELARHCRRKTRGVTETTQLISDLIETFSGDKGRNTLGVPLIDQSRMTSIWKAQRKHIACIQDPPGVSLYTRTGSTKRGGIELPDFRCGRGSTSLESFHLHLNRFIPGTTASDVLFQAYILDGLHRWNEDRERAATSTPASYQSYSGLLRHTANVLGMKVLKRKVAPTYNEPRKYTGELIGIEYLYSQTGKVLEDCMKAIETLETVEDETIDTSEDDEVPQDTDIIDDLTVSTVGLKESSDIVLEAPTLLQETEVSHPSSSSHTPILNIPTSEDYSAMLRDTVVSPITEPIHPIQTPAVREKRVIDPIPTPAVREKRVKDPIPTPAVREERVIDPVPTPAAQQTHDIYEPVDPVSTPAAGEDVTDSESETDESLGPDNIPGYGRVQEFAAYLISLREELYLTNTQVNQIVKLWNDLPNYDKKPTVFPERFSREARGRFKAKKSVRNVVPGVESTERCIRGGPGAVPASWPNANRYTEAIFVQLFKILPKNRKRLDEAMKAYYNIRQLILDSGRVKSETKIQLPEISRGTLLQWFTKRGKDQDKAMVTQGVRFDAPSKTTAEGVPAAVVKPAKLPTGKAESHTFVCPTNTAGMARMKGQKKSSRRAQISSTQSTPAEAPVQSNAPESVIAHPTPKSTPVFIAPRSTVHLTIPQLTTVPPSTYPLATPKSTSPLTAAQSTFSATDSQSTFKLVSPLSSTPVSTLPSTSGIPVILSTSAGPSAMYTVPLHMKTVEIDGQSYTVPQSQTGVPYTTQRYRKRKLEQGVVKRKYERKKIILCKHCGQERAPPVHVQYFMNWFCGTTSTITLEEWKEELLRKGYGRKQKH